MIGRSPQEIWARSLADGEVRLRRRTSVLAATSLLAGFHVMLGLLALVVATGALSAVMPAPSAHVLGALTFGVAFVFLTLGRTELFTENFLIPVSTVLAGRGSKRALARLWSVALVMNLVGIALFAALLAAPGVLQDEAASAAGDLADTLLERSLGAAFLSAVLAGAVITLFTWLTEAAESEVTRVLVSIIVGFVLLAPSTNHSIVGFGEVLLGILTGTTPADALDLLRNLGIAIAGNLVGGVGFVTSARFVQASEAMGSKPPPEPPAPRPAA